MRDRLRNMIANIITSADDTRTFEDIVADELIAQGVIVPPCKVGDTVYVISSTRVKEAKVYEMCIIKDNRMLFLIMFDCDEDCDGCPFNTWSKSYCGEWYCGGQYGHTTLDESDFGKTVFLTREEAEKALAERKVEDDS